MKLAIGSGVAFRAPLLQHGRAALDEPGRLRSHLAWWKKQGVEGIVFYDNYPDFYQRPIEHFRVLKTVLDEVGLPVGAFNALRKSLFVPELADLDEKQLYRCLEVAVALGTTILDLSVNVPLPSQRDAQTAATRQLFRGDYAPAEFYEEAARRLKPFVRACAQAGLELSLELHDDGLQDTADNCLRLLHLIDEPNVGVNPDLGNWARVHYEHLDTWRDQVGKLAAKTNYWEVKNYRSIYLPSEHRYQSWPTLLDEGMIDFREAATILWQAGFRGWVGNEGGAGDYVRAQLHFIEYFRWILDEWIPTALSEIPPPSERG
ncbi:MAG TPA: TIM barrel protein [Chloroflexota bacterium]|nr:TIM barrel protein [Chloroflexota bacterium]